MYEFIIRYDAKIEQRGNAILSHATRLMHFIVYYITKGGLLVYRQTIESQFQYILQVYRFCFRA